MAELLINISPEKEALVIELIEQLGGTVTQKPRKKSLDKKNSKSNISHDYLFGKWKEFDIDAGKIREELWSRS